MNAVIFDIDGTLVQSLEVDGSHFSSAIKAVLGPVEFRPNWGDYEHVTDTGIISALLSDNAISADDSLMQEIERVHIASMGKHLDARGPLVEVPGANEFCQALLQSADHVIAMATGAWRSSALLKLKSAGIDASEIPLATCNDAMARTDIMETALAKLGSTFDSITYYGDGAWDQKACADLAWDFVAVGPVLNGLESYPMIERR